MREKTHPELQLLRGFDKIRAYSKKIPPSQMGPAFSGLIALITPIEADKYWLWCNLNLRSTQIVVTRSLERLLSTKEHKTASSLL